MTRTSTVVWSLVGLVVVLLGVLGAIYGPEMYRQGKAIVGPIVEIAQSEDRLAALNTEMPFEADPDGTIADDRFSVFLAIRRDLLPRYLEWRDIEQQLEQHRQEDWDSAREVLSAIQGVMTLQFDTLRTHGMSPAEFVWIEDLVYNTWVPGAEDTMEASAVTEQLRETTVADKETLAELERRHGSSRASREFTDLLDQRLQSLDNPGPPMVEGVSEATSALCWTHRDELANLDLAAYSRLHEILRGNHSVSINIDDDDE